MKLGLSDNGIGVFVAGSIKETEFWVLETLLSNVAFTILQNFLLSPAEMDSCRMT